MTLLIKSFNISVNQKGEVIMLLLLKISLITFLMSFSAGFWFIYKVYKQIYKNGYKLSNSNISIIDIAEETYYLIPFLSLLILPIANILVIIKLFMKRDLVFDDIITYCRAEGIIVPKDEDKKNTSLEPEIIQEKITDYYNSLSDDAQQEDLEKQLKLELVKKKWQ